jgi:hypothetical protein
MDGDSFATTAMKRTVRLALPFGVAAALLFSGGAGAAPSMPPGAARLEQIYERLPLAFEPGEGGAGASFVCRTAGSTLYLTPDEAVLRLAGAPDGGPGGELRLRLVGDAAVGPRRGLQGGSQGGSLSGEAPQAARSNYLLGPDPRRWRTGVAHYGRVRKAEVYPGIDLVYHGRERRLEYDLEVAPGADPRQIRVAFDGVRRITLGAGGELTLETAAGEVHQPAPEVYQEIGGRRRPVAARYVLYGHAAGRAARGAAGTARGAARAVRGAVPEIGFALGSYDRARPLVIDPTLVYATFLGEADGNYAAAIATDAAGNLYVTGFSSAPTFTGVTAGSLQPANHGVINTFVTKIDAAGTAVVYSTFLGGSGVDEAASLAVDATGSVYVAGVTTSADFPVTAGAVQQTPGGGVFDGFVSKLDATGSALVYSTYLGGSAQDSASRIVVDAAGSAYVAGCTASTDFPGVGSGSLQGANAGDDDAFVTKLDAAGSAIVYSTYLGGSGDDCATALAVDAAGNAYVAGYTSSATFPGVTGSSLQPTNAGGMDTFVTKLDAAGTAIVYSTFLGGSGDDGASSLALDAAGSVYVAGVTTSASFPGAGAASLQAANAGGEDAFVAKLDPAGAAVVYATFLGGSAADEAAGIAVDAAGDAYVTGFTTSPDFPGVSAAALQPSPGIPPSGFLAELDPRGTALLYSTYLGTRAEGFAIALGRAGNVYLAGRTLASTFPGVGPGSLEPVNTAVTASYVARLSLGSGFHTLPPCRLVDTRGAVAPLGGPALPAGGERTFTATAACGIPTTAVALALNVTVPNAKAAGAMRLYPAGTPLPVATATSFPGGQTRACNTIVRLAAGAFTVHLDDTAATDLVVDVSGYFQ